MTEIFGWLNKIIETDGYRLTVSVRSSKNCTLSSGSVILCSAVMPPFPKYTPVLFHGEFQNGTFAASDFSIWTSPEGVTECLSSLHVMNARDSRRILKSVNPAKLLRAEKSDYDFLIRSGLTDYIRLSGLSGYMEKKR